MTGLMKTRKTRRKGPRKMTIVRMNFAPAVVLKMNQSRVKRRARIKEKVSLNLPKLRKIKRSQRLPPVAMTGKVVAVPKMTSKVLMIQMMRKTKNRHRRRAKKAQRRSMPISYSNRSSRTYLTQKSFKTS